MDCSQKKLYASVAVPAAPVRVPSPVRHVSSSNDMDDYKVKPGAVHGSPNICLTAEENPGKSQLGDNFMNVV